MQEFIITTPDQLKTVISETVKTEVHRQLLAQNTAETQKNKDYIFSSVIKNVVLILRLIYLFISSQ